MKKIIFIIVISFFYSFNSTGAIKIIFRYDDLKLIPDSTNEKVVNLFQKQGIPLVVGVIPYDKNSNRIYKKNYKFIDTLKLYVKSKSVEIAQHGFNHIRVATGEFENLPYKQQFVRIEEGKLFLDSLFSIAVTSFIPPWNKYDLNTLDVLSKLKFSVLSSALCPDQPCSNQQLLYFPCTLEDFDDLLQVVKANRGRNGVIVVMFHPYTFSDEKSYNKTVSILAQLKDLPYVEFKTFAELNLENENSGQERFKSNMESNFLYKKLHLKGMIQETEFINRIRILNTLLYIFVYTLLFWFVLLIYLKRIFLTKIIISAYFSLLPVVAISVYFHILAPIKLFLVLGLITIILVGIIIYFTKRRS